MQHEPGFRVGLVGATGAVGREALRILEARRFPAVEIRLFASARSAGTRLGHRTVNAVAGSHKGRLHGYIIGCSFCDSP